MTSIIRNYFYLIILLFFSSFTFATPNSEPQKDLCYLIVDRSGSIKTNDLVEPITAAIKNYLDDVRSNTEVRLVFFDDKRSSVKKWDSMNLANRNDFNDYFDDEFKAAGMTCLFDTIYDSLSEVKSENYKLVNVIILSDGDDTASKRYKSWQDIEKLGLSIKSLNANSFLRWYTLGFTPTKTPKKDSPIQNLNVRDIKNFIIKEPAPVVSFTASPQRCEVATRILFAPEILGKKKDVKWDFGDGNFSSKTTPFHSYTKAGTYTVSIEVQGPGGTTTKTIRNFIEVKASVKPKADFFFFPKKVYKDQAIKITNESEGYSSYVWEINGKNYTDANPVVTITGDCEIVLTVTNKKGEINTKRSSVVVIVRPKPIAAFIVVNKVITRGSMIEVIDRSEHNIKSKNQWFLDGVQVSTGSDFSYKTQKSLKGKYEVKLVVTNEAGKTSSKSTTIDVVTTPKPVAALSKLEQTIRVGETVSIFDRSQNHLKSRNKWLLDGAEKSSGTDFKYQSTKTGIFTVKLIVFNEDNEQDVKEFKLKVLPKRLDGSVSEFSILPKKPSMGEFVTISALKNIDNVTHEWLIVNSRGKSVKLKGSTVKFECKESGIVNVTHNVISSIGEITKKTVSFNVILSFSSLNIVSNIDEGRVPLNVALKEDSGQRITSYKWFMNDKEFSSKSNPSIILEEEGEYLFELEAIMVNGSIVKTTKDLKVIVLPPPSLFSRYWWVLIILFICYKIFRKLFPKNPKVVGTIKWWSTNNNNLVGEEFVDQSSYSFNTEELGLTSEFIIKGHRGKLALFKDGQYTVNITHYEECELEDDIYFEIN